MGVGPSKVGPTIPESDDVSFKSFEEKPTQKKKPGIVRFIIDALLGVKSSSSPDELGFPPFSESPESGTDFNVEETFVDAPLPAAHQGKDARAERRVTPGRARAKKRNVISKFYSIDQNVQFIKELSRPPYNDRLKVEKIQPVEDKSTLDITRLHPSSNESNESLEIPWSHGRGDNAPSTSQKLNGPCNLQSNNNSVNIPSSDAQGTTALSTIQKIFEMSAPRSDKVNTINDGHGGREGKLQGGKNPYSLAFIDETTRGSTASNDIISRMAQERPLISSGDNPNASTVTSTTANKKSYPILKRAQGKPWRQKDHQTRAILDKKRVDMFTVEKKKDSAGQEEVSVISTAINDVLNGSKYGKVPQRQIIRNVPLPHLPFPVADHQDMLYPNRVMMKTTTNTSQVGPLDAVVKIPGQTVSNVCSSPLAPCNTPVGKPLYIKDSKADNLGKKETKDIEEKAEVPKFQTIFQTQIPSVAELRGKVEEARKELDSIQNYIRATNKGVKLQNVANSQVREEMLAQNESLAPASLKSMEGDMSIDAQGEEQEKPLLCPVFDEPVPRCVVFKGKELGIAATSERNSVQHKAPKDVLKTLTSCTGEDKSTDGVFVTKKGSALKRLASRNMFRRKTSPRPVKAPSGSDKHPEPSPSKVPVNPAISCADHCDTDAATASAPKGEAEQVNQCTTTLTCSSRPRIPALSDVTHTNGDSNSPQPQHFKEPTCRGADPKTEGKVLRMNPIFSTESKNHVDTKKKQSFRKHQLVPNEIFDAFRDDSMHALSMMWMRPITRKTFNNAMHLLVRCLSNIKQSTKKYFPIPSTSNIRGLYVTRISDRELESLFQESLTWWEQKRPAVLFNSKFYPRRLFQPYLGILSNDVELNAESYHVHGVQHLPVIVDHQEIEGTTDGVKVKEADIYPKERRAEKPEEDNVQANGVSTSQVHPKSSLRLAKERILIVMAEVNDLMEAYIKCQSAVDIQSKPDIHQRREVSYWYRKMNKWSRRMNSFESNPAGTLTSVGSINSYEKMLIEYHKALKKFDEWKKQIIKANESLQSQETKPGEKEAIHVVVQQSAVNAHGEPNSTSDQRLDVTKRVLTAPSKTTSRYTNEESVEDLRHVRIDVNGDEMPTEITVESDSNGMKEVDKDDDRTGNPVSDDQNVTTTATVLKNDCGSDGVVSKSLAEAGKDVTSQVKKEPSGKTDIKTEVKSQNVSGDGDSSAGVGGRYTRRKLGRGPRIVGDMRRIVHCQRNRRTDTPTTQLKIKFCLGCGDTRQPNGEPLIQCATCDQAFFCCTKCQRETRNEHRETCKGVKRNYCKHW